MARARIGRCWICGHPIVRRPYVEQTDAAGRLVLHFACWTNARAPRLREKPPACTAATAYNPSIAFRKVCK